ncbi:RagB/SusD family nutrient uptake outer membrane protein [Flavivirga sp. 57AJ16]|uniref:RagB/SusD family nutrient uptake outer membrane protein n=1 Tax=Flavivirga sp. 57AJ16 TaxID=3025307 RepID=UPI0023660EAB|nr:RagB/SusD family nutrient uptake outer membrane protein [Flavivirga sp. 57AJ16]MDD7888204.1 RagB/SusD family nutrient uptake outer membrane protein [Flavivirga sp. 57AJ16]
MKKNLIIIIALVSFFGCDDYLDVVPDNRQTVTTLDDVSELLVSAYSEATYNFVEWKTDNVTAIPDNDQFDWMTENYQFTPVVSEEGQDTPTYFWDNNYQAIAHANQALEGLDGIDGGDVGYRNALRGEALMTRAYHHFMLANVFCQHYNDANKEGLGVPYITAPETSLKVEYERGTLEQTYEMIEKDMLEALPLISDAYYEGTGKYHFTKTAANAFASRFYLFKGDYQKCIDYSDKVLGNGVINTTYVRDMDEVFTGTSSTQIADQFNEINSPYNIFVVRKESFSNRYYRGYRMNTNIFSNVVRANIQQSADQRDLLYSYGTQARQQPKYNELFEFTTSTTGFGYIIMTQIRGEEVVLNRMESYVRLNRLDDALNDYNVFATLRYDTGGQLTLPQIVAGFGGTEQEAMLDFVLLERRKEFLAEGLRWFDIKRLSIEVRHVDVNGDEFVLGEEDLRKAVQIPETATTNGIEANPR